MCISNINILTEDVWVWIGVALLLITAIDRSKLPEVSKWSSISQHINNVVDHIHWSYLSVIQNGSPTTSCSRLRGTLGCLRIPIKDPCEYISQDWSIDRNHSLDIAVADIPHLMTSLRWAIRTSSKLIPVRLNAARTLEAPPVHFN